MITGAFALEHTFGTVVIARTLVAPFRPFEISESSLSMY